MTIEKRVLWGEDTLRAYYVGPFATTTEPELLRFIADDLDREDVETVVSVVFDLDSETDEHRAKVTYTLRRGSADRVVGAATSVTKHAARS